MAQIAVSAFAAMTTAAASTGTAIAGAAASTLTSLSGAATALSMASTLLGGVAALRSSSDQAKASMLDAQGDELAARERALRIKQEYVKGVGANRVAFAGAGLDISSGSELEASLAAQSDFETDLALSSGAMSAAGKRMQAAGYNSRGVTSLIGAASKAAGQYADFRLDLARRGSGGDGLGAGFGKG